MAIAIAIFKRSLWIIGTVFAVLILNFLLIHLAPGDPAEVIAGESGGATKELMLEIRKSYGLDQPITVQLFTYLKKTITGDFGMSFYYNSPVLDLILSRLGATLILVFCALLIALTFGVTLGVIASKNPQGLLSNFVTVLALFGFSAPVFWTGSMFIIYFSSSLQLFPIAGIENPRLSGSGFMIELLDFIHHLILPTFTLAIIYIAQYARLVRSGMIEILSSDYIRTAYAKGVSEFKIYTKHALRNAILPVITLAGIQFGTLISGAVLVETVFSWPGIGTLAFDAILARDYPTILGILFFSALMVIFANLITDILYKVIDPRITLK